uniref:Uncharacterized protein n=1 Tax=Salix viminalis TaxID=40686 RepID=A0A6N2MGB1_SALVM
MDRKVTIFSANVHHKFTIARLQNKYGSRPHRRPTNALQRENMGHPVKESPGNIIPEHGPRP